MPYGTYACRMCGQKFPSHLENVRHMITHVRSYLCMECGQRFNHAQSLTEHIAGCPRGRPAQGDFASDTGDEDAQVKVLDLSMKSAKPDGVPQPLVKKADLFPLQCIEDKCSPSVSLRQLRDEGAVNEVHILYPQVIEGKVHVPRVDRAAVIADGQQPEQVMMVDLASQRQLRTSRSRPGPRSKSRRCKKGPRPLLLSPRPTRDRPLRPLSENIWVPSEHLSVTSLRVDSTSNDFARAGRDESIIVVAPSKLGTIDVSTPLLSRFRRPASDQLGTSPHTPIPSLGVAHAVQGSPVCACRGVRQSRRLPADPGGKHSKGAARPPLGERPC